MEQKALPEVCHIQYGYPFDSKRFSDKEGFPLIRIRDVVRGHTETFTTESCNDEYIVKKGDILIGMDGMFNVAKWKGNTAYLNQRVCKIEPNSSIVADYLFYYLPCALKKIENKTAFVTVKHLKAKQLNSILIPYPPVKEQKRIAQILDLLFYLICQKKKQLNYLDELVKSRFIEMFGDSQSNPKGFPYKRINEFAKCIAGATPSTKRKEYWSNGIIPWMSSGEVNYKRIWETEKRISQVGYDSCSTKMIPAHTVVIAMAGQGRTRGTVAVAEIPLCTNQSLCSIITDGTVDTDYLFTYLQFQYNNLRNISNGSSGRGGLNIKLIGQFAVLVPPLAIQQKFSNFLKEIDKSKLAVQKSLDELEILKKSLMQTYFG